MKSIIILFTFCYTIQACNSISLPPNVEVKNTDPLLSKINREWIYKKNLFNGYVIEVENDGSVVYKLPIIKGKEQGMAVAYYNSGEKLLERPYLKGERQGEFKQWWPNGNLRYLFNYNHDQYDGKQIVYFHFGKVQEEKNYTNGIEDGPQRIWDSTGNLISNYFVKNKKVYGALSARDCMPVSH